MSSSKISLDRKTLAEFLPNRQAVAVFEQALKDVGETLPNDIESANAAASFAISAAQDALAAVVELAEGLLMLLAAPAQAEPLPPEDMAPRLEVGTLAPQDAESVAITGGRIGLDAGTETDPSFYLLEQHTGFYRIDVDNIGLSINTVKLLDFSSELARIVGRVRIDVGTVAAPALYFGADTGSGLYRIGADHWGLSIAGTLLVDFSSALVAITGDLSVTGQLKSTLATGTAPLVVASTTKVANLYVDRAELADTATTLTDPTTFPADATDLPTAITLVNALKAAAIAKGL